MRAIRSGEPRRMLRHKRENQITPGIVEDTPPALYIHAGNRGFET